MRHTELISQEFLFSAFPSNSPPLLLLFNSYTVYLMVAEIPRVHQIRCGSGQKGVARVNRLTLATPFRGGEAGVGSPWIFIDFHHFDTLFPEKSVSF